MSDERGYATYPKKERLIDRLEKEIEQLKELIYEAAPLSWVVYENMDGAKEWEIKAQKALKKGE